MDKLIVLIKGTSGERFADWYCRQFAPAARASLPGIQRWTISLPDPALSDPDFEVVSELWGSGEACAAVHRTSPFPASATAFEYAVDEFTEKGAGTSPVPGALKVIGCALPKPEHSRETTRQFWDAHVPLALQVHTGISHYVRNWVRAPTAGTPGYFGFPMLYFPTRADFQDRYFGPGDARQRHAADIRQFVGRAVKLICSEQQIA